MEKYKLTISYENNGSYENVTIESSKNIILKFDIEQKPKHDVFTSILGLYHQLTDNALSEIKDLKTKSHEKNH